MVILQKFNALNIRYPKLGLILYISSIQYFLVQLLVGYRFSPFYSLSNNTISDLGNTRCGIYNNKIVCSPLHSYMNISFIFLGITMIMGSILIYNQYSKSRIAFLGYSLFALGGLGVILVGLFPENSIPAIHSISAALPFLIGNLGIILIGLTNKSSKMISFYSIITGVIALLALIVYVSGHYLGLGQGGLERLVSYPQTIWMIFIGIYYLICGKNNTNY